MFVWDTILEIDPWVTLGAVAMRTERVRLGPIVTPVARRRPWKLACETATLDRLSNGRLVLPVGLGSDEDGWERLGEETSRTVRAKRLDEGLDILTGLWSGQPFSYAGQHYRVTEATGLRPVQSPRIPIWVVGGRWPNPDVPGSKLRRMLRWDGVLMNKEADFRAFRALVEEHRTETTPFDIVVEGETPGGDGEAATSAVCPLAEAGVTWWLENLVGLPWEGGGLRESTSVGTSTCSHGWPLHSSISKPSRLRLPRSPTVRSGASSSGALGWLPTAILLIDTDDNLTEFLGSVLEVMLPVVRPASGIVDASWRPERPFIRPQPDYPGVNFGYVRTYVVNSQPPILRQIQRCLVHYNARVRDVPRQGGP